MRPARTRLTAALAAGGTTAALVLAPMTGASAAATTLTINVGSGVSVHGFVLEGMRFDAPDTISVHRGDVLTFNFKGFHTATLIPAGTGADDWRMDHTGPGGDYALIQSDADDPQPAFEFNKKVLFPSAANCGATTAPCAYNGSATACATETEPGLKCFIYTHPPYLSAEAIKLAVDILDGHPPASKTVLGDYPRLTTDIVSGDFSKGSDLRKLEVGVNVFPDLPPGLVLPASPDWVNITAEEAAGTGG